MGTASKIISLAPFIDAKSFSGPDKNGGKIVSQNMPLENGKAPENKAFQAPSGNPVNTGSGDNAKKGKGKGKKAGAKTLKVTDVPGPKGYKHDALNLSATALRLAYPLTYSSWKHRKHWCKKHPDYAWDPAWETFSAFLSSEGPRPSKDHSLDRIDNAIKAYGPGLCQWATKVEQNNNKGNNIKIVHPTTGEEFTSHKLAKKHGVKLATIHKWNALGYTNLEMIAGKKDHDLASVSLALPPPPPKVVKRRQLRHRRPPTPNEDTDCTPDDLDHYQETGEMRLSIFVEKLAEYEKLDEWITRWNAGLPCSPQPPQGKYYHPKLPLPPPPPQPSPPQSFAFSQPDYPDPADDVEPDNPQDDDYDQDDDYEPTSSTPSTSGTAFAGHLGASRLSFLGKLKKQSEDEAWSEAKMMTTDDDEDE
jgi:hypothetical protein